MEEKPKNTESKSRKNSVTKSGFDPLEFWNLCRKDGTRQYASVSKAKSRLVRHESSINSASEEDKTLVSIQKKLEALSSVQSSINQDLRNNHKTLSQISPPRQLSARRVRKGVIYRPTQRLKHNIFEFKNLHLCNKCKVSWVTSLSKKTCELCSLNFQGTAFEIELKMPTEENKNAVLVLGEKEIQVNFNSRFKCIVTIPHNFVKKEISDGSKTFEIQVENDWSEFSRVATPSFHLNTERVAENTQNSNSSFFFGEVSFSENSKSWQDLYKEIDSIVNKKFSVLELNTLDKIKENCESVVQEYTKIFKKIGGFAFQDLATAIDKSIKGFVTFFESSITALIRILGQLQDKNLMWKDSEQKYLSQINSLTKLLQRYHETPQLKKNITKF